MAKEKTKPTTTLYIADMGDLISYDAKRKGQSSPLPWGKFRTPANPSVRSSPGERSRHERYSLRRSTIKAAADGFAVLGIYDEIFIFFGLARRAALRGWLVNHNYQPSTAAQIGAVIGCSDTKLVRRALRLLTKEGLLVDVELLDMAAADKRDKTTCPAGQTLPSRDEADDPDDVPSDDCPDGQEEGDQGEASTQTGQNENDGGVPERPPDGSGPTLLDVRQETTDSETGRLETPNPAAAAPQPSSADGYGKTQRQEQTASASPRPADGQTAEQTADDCPPGNVPPADGTEIAPAGQLASDGPQPDPGAQAEPIEPTEADPPGQADMRWHAEAYARQIFESLYPDRATIVAQGRRAKEPQTAEEFTARELASFAKVFDRALTGMGQVDAVKLLQRSLQEAVASHRKRCKTTRGRYWCYWFGQHMAAYRREHAERSGPPGGEGGCG